MDDLQEIRALLEVVEKLAGHPNLNYLRKAAMDRLQELNDDLAPEPKVHPEPVYPEPEPHVETMAEKNARLAAEAQAKSDAAAAVAEGGRRV